MKRSVWFCSLAFFLTMGLGSWARAQVWSQTSNWNEDWERRYTQWVQDHWNQTVFTSAESLYQGLATDCADATYAMRALFSYLHELPFAVHTAQGTKLDNQTSRFNSFAAGRERFRQFMKHVFAVTDTRTLALDTYPVAITRQTLRPGTVYVSPGVHSYQIIRVNEYGIITTLSSTSPESVRVLFKNEGYPFYIPSSGPRRLDGFRAFRWPSEFSEPVGRISRASSQQYQWALEAQDNYFVFTHKLIQALKLKTEPLEDSVERGYHNLCYFARERAHLVIRAHAKRLDEGKACFDRESWDVFSTTSRDKRLKDYFTFFKKLRSDPRWEELDLKSRKKLLSVFVRNVDFNECEVETGAIERPRLSLYEVGRLVEEGKLLADANADILQRWGLKPHQSRCE